MLKNVTTPTAPHTPLFTFRWGDCYVKAREITVDDLVFGDDGQWDAEWCPYSKEVRVSIAATFRHQAWEEIAKVVPRLRWNPFSNDNYAGNSARWAFDRAATAGNLADGPTECCWYLSKRVPVVLKGLRKDKQQAKIDEAIAFEKIRFNSVGIPAREVLDTFLKSLNDGLGWRVAEENKEVERYVASKADSDVAFYDLPDDGALYTMASVDALNAQIEVLQAQLNGLLEARQKKVVEFLTARLTDDADLPDELKDLAKQQLAKNGFGRRRHLFF